MALIKCKECGKEISKDAEVCPHCGKKVTSPLEQLIISIVVLGGIIGFVFNDTENNKSSSYSTKTVQIKNIVYQQVNPRELERKLEENAARAQQQYKNKYIEFDGKLEVIDANGEYFSIKTDSFLSNIRCDITNRKQKKVLINKNVGDIIHVKGKITHVGEVAGYSIEVIELK